MIPTPGGRDSFSQWEQRQRITALSVLHVRNSGPIVSVLVPPSFRRLATWAFTLRAPPSGRFNLGIIDPSWFLPLSSLARRGPLPSVEGLGLLGLSVLVPCFFLYCNCTIYQDRCQGFMDNFLPPLFRPTLD